MKKISFIHLSDIHFVKTSGNPADVDNDLRNALLTDIRLNAKNDLQEFDGILVGGDIAFSGNKEEYKKAKEFLEEITNIFNKSKSSVYCVPGNHDVNQLVPKNSLAVYEAQCKLDQIESLDETDKKFENYINDHYYNDILFKTTQEYNDFASMFECNTHSGMINWVHVFDMDYNMKLKIHGINSCFLSNSDDHKKDNRLMYIGQTQIPTRDQDVIVMSLCHHPPEYWKFLSDIQTKMNKRADIQLYGHKHTQSISLTSENVIITSGATHPVRGTDWNPRYNWITLECQKLNSKRIIKINIYPRILDEYRDRFIPDAEFCNGKNYIEHILEIDKKREKDLLDICVKEEYKKQVNNHLEWEKKQQIHESKIDQRDLMYKFFDLSYIRQTEILIELDLLDENDKGKRYSNIITTIMKKAKANNKIDLFWQKIHN
ncbi:metallophosphoesterase [Anaerospora sp.]|uniref:metallophosphoesterase n=1 Tax=Anaerospora sp. TaxID=1960278 RepID=UPI0028A2C7B7|nr:metallophosphoesterase [Anaerospora sp.]